MNKVLKRSDGDRLQITIPRCSDLVLLDTEERQPATLPLHMSMGSGSLLDIRFSNQSGIIICRCSRHNPLLFVVFCLLQPHLNVA